VHPTTKQSQNQTMIEFVCKEALLHVLLFSGECNTINNPVAPGKRSRSMKPDACKISQADFSNLKLFSVMIYGQPGRNQARFTTRKAGALE